MVEGGNIRGRSLELDCVLAETFSLAGLQDVTECVYNLPIGTWPKDKEQKFIGSNMLLGALAGMEGFVMVMFTKALGWSAEAAQEFVEKCNRDLRDDSLRKFLDLYVCCGRKPTSEAAEG